MPAASHKSPFHRWELITCAWKGHETYKPSGSDNALALAKKLSAQTPQGEAWLCLRCGLYKNGPPKFKAKLSAAPIVMRGKSLRQAMILRLLAIERIIRGLFLVLLGYGILRFKSSQGSLSKVIEQALPGLHSVANSIGYNLDSSQTLHVIREALSLGQNTLTMAAIAAFVYAAVQFIEGTGLWLMKRWGEYFAVVATSLFIPLEIYELSHHFTVIKLITFAINLAAVAYLLISKRLFGIRGGRKAYEADLQGNNLLEIIQSTS